MVDYEVASFAIISKMSLELFAEDACFTIHRGTNICNRSHSMSLEQERLLIFIDADFAIV